MMHRLRLLLILTAALLLAGTGARLGETPAALADANVVTSHAKVQASGFDGGGTLPPPVTKQDSDFSAFSEIVNAVDDPNDGRSAEGEAVQVTTVDFTDPLDSTVNTVGGATASWTDPEPGDGKDPRAHGKSEFTITFEVTSAASHFSLVGSIAASAGAANADCTTVTVTSPSGTTFDVSAPDGCGSLREQAIDDSGELGVGTHTFSVVANAFASNPNATGGSAAASFNLSLSLAAAPILDGVEFTQAIQQLQSVQELQADLAGDGKPPVPMIAGKPAAMRVYFGEVEDTTNYTVEVSGELDEELSIILDPGCTPTDRRRGANNCESLDFYLTPPEGDWSVRLVVKDAADETVLDEVFNLTSLKTDDVTLKAVSVCDSEGGPGGAWECQDAFPLIDDASLVRRMFPTANLKVIVTGDFVRRDESAYAQTKQWWGAVDRDLDALFYTAGDEVFSQLGTEIYYVGLVRNEVPGNSSGSAYNDTRGAASRPSIPSTVAHEVGHAMDIDHTNTAVPNLSGNAGCWLGGERTTLPPWPYADNMLRSGAAPGQLEVGFDVASGTPLPGDLFYEIMGYCVAPAPPLAPDITRWISPFSTMELLKPAGPLSLDSALPQAQSASVAGDFWLVSGTLDGIPQEVVFDPLVTLELEGSAGAGTGSHRIEVRDGNGGLLFTRLFTPAHGHASPSPGDPVEATPDAFAELIPVQAGAALIQVFDAFNTPIGQIELTGAAPEVAITLPASFEGTQTISWSVSDPDSTEHTYWVDYSPDGGQTWHSQARGLTEAELALDFDLLAASDGQGVFRVIASDGVNSGEAMSQPFTVAGKAPHGQITGPSGKSFRLGDLVWLEAAAWDIDDGTLDDAAVTWSSSRDGALGTGADLPVYDLSVGQHTITMIAKDSDNSTATDSITLTVFDGPIVEIGAVADLDCSGGVDVEDALALLYHLAGLDAEPCKTIGDGEPVAFGDADCDGIIGPGDVVAVLALAADLPRGCA